MVDDDMKVVLLLLAFVAVLYGMARVIDDGPTYRDAPSLLMPMQELAQTHARG